jgi:hypothetical protein
MIRCTKFAVAVLACVLAAAPASAQSPSVFLGLGPAIPMGDYGDVTDLGWMVNAGVLVPLGQAGAWIGGEAMYGRNGIPDFDESATLTGAGGMIGMTFSPMQRVAPFVFGSVGFMSFGSTFEGSESDSGLAFGGGGGVRMMMSPSASLWAAGRFINARVDGENLQVLPLAVGVTFMLGGAR